MMKRTIYLTIFIFTLVAVICVELMSAELDPTLEKLELSGFLRIRHWNLTSRNQLGGNFDFSDDYKNTYYEDVFFRNRFYLKALPNVQVRSVFDVFSYFGKGGFALGSGETNIITRDVYIVINPTENSELSFGLMPFSLPGGHILARDASGAQYNHSFLKNSLKFYAAVVRAYDDANDSYGNNSDPPEYADDNIFYAGIITKFIPSLTNELYFVYENDAYEDAMSGGDTRKSKMSWVGFHNKLNAGRLYLNIGGIYNRGSLYLWNSGTSRFDKTEINAGLFELDAGYRAGSFQVAAVAEGATGDASDSNGENSFQDIKASHGFSFIVVDDLGGLTYRGSGESSWYGLYGYGLSVRYAIFDSVSMMFKAVDFRTTKDFDWEGKPVNWLGSEFDFRAEYIYREALSIFLTAGAFFPRDAYNALVNYSTSGAVIEVMLGARVNY